MEIFVIADEIAAHDRAVVCDGVSEVTDFAGLAVEFAPSSGIDWEISDNLEPNSFVIAPAKQSHPKGKT